MGPLEGRIEDTFRLVSPNPIAMVASDPCVSSSIICIMHSISCMSCGHFACVFIDRIVRQAPPYMSRSLVDVDVEDTDSAYLVTVDIPGFSK